MIRSLRRSLTHFFSRALATAVQQVNLGRVKAQVTDGHCECIFDGFSLLL